MKRLILAVLAAFILATPAHAKDVIRRGATGFINWTNGYIYAKGYGPIDPKQETKAKAEWAARRVAIVDGQRNLLEMTEGVRLTSTVIVKDLVETSKVIQSRVSGLMRGAEIIDEKLEEGGMFTVTLRLPIRGEFLQAMLSSKMMGESEFQSEYRMGIAGLAGMISGWLLPGEAMAVDFTPEDRSTLNKILQLVREKGPEAGLREIEKAMEELDSAANYTGVVIDARQVPDFDIAACPLLKTPDGEVLYPAALVTLDAAQTIRPVTYDLDIHDAMQNRRVASSPVIIKAQGIYKQRQSDLTFSQDDVLKLKSLYKTDLLKRCKVVIVVGE